MGYYFRAPHPTPLPKPHAVRTYRGGTEGTAEGILRLGRRTVASGHCEALAALPLEKEQHSICTVLKVMLKRKLRAPAENRTAIRC